MTPDTTETTIIGGGIVGLATALGLLEAGYHVRVLDGPDNDQRASLGNFGLVWLQGKGAGYAPYARWTARAVSAWPEFALKIKDLSDIDPMLSQPGGYEFFTDSREFQDFCGDLKSQQKILGKDIRYETLTGDELRRNLPGIGPGVAGATYCANDGHVNPLFLLRALRRAVLNLDGEIVPETPVRTIETPPGGGFVMVSQDGRRFGAERIVLCAGLGAKSLGPQLGFHTPIRPQRGELLITEKLDIRLPFLSSTIRQVNEGGIQIGGTKAEAGLDDSDTMEMGTWLARHAVTVYPPLADVRVLRSWGALRIMSQDGYPIYAQSPAHAGAFLVTCHSGVTLAPVHAGPLVAWLNNASTAPDLEAFDENRFALSPAT